MAKKIMLYGADQFFGRLLAAEAFGEWGNAPGSAFVPVLAGTQSGPLDELSKIYGLEYRAFDVDDATALAQVLADIDVLVNAAEPFVTTAEPLSTAAMLAGCHYLDTNAEVAGYLRIESATEVPKPPNVPAILRAGGPSAAASELMLDAALRQLTAAGTLTPQCGLGTIRIALACIEGFSRDSAAAVWNALSVDVTVARSVVVLGGGPAQMMRLENEPIGKLEATFDFTVAGATTAAPTQSPAPAPVPVPSPTAVKNLRIASAANLTDTVAAKFAVERQGLLAQAIESYAEMSTLSRIGLSLGAATLPHFSPIANTAFGRSITGAGLRAVPPGPGGQERGVQRYTIVLTIEDEQRTLICDWRMRTPNLYDLGARSAVRAAARLAAGAFSGLVTPAQVLDTDLAPAPPAFGRALRDCVLDKRVLN